MYHWLLFPKRIENENLIDYKHYIDLFFFTSELLTHRKG